MKSLVFFLCALVVRSSCQVTSSTTKATQPVSAVGAQARAINDSRVPQRDKELRNEFNNRGTVQDWSSNQEEDSQQQQQQVPGSALVPAIPLPPGSTIVTPAAQQQLQTTGSLQPASTSQIAVQTPVRVQTPQQSDTRSLLSILGSKSFMDILSPPMLSQQDATKNLIPPLVTDGMQKTLQQQQVTRQGQAGNQQQQPGYAGYPQQGGMDPRQGSLYPAGGVAGYPQQYGQYPQQQPMYGAQPAMGGYGGQQLYPQQAGGFQQQPLLSMGQYSGGLNNGGLNNGAFGLGRR